MPTDAFFQAAYCQPAIVSGRQLLPFSLSHLMLLRGLNNGVILTGEGTRSEFLTAVLVCSQTHDQNARALFGGTLRTFRLMLWAALWPDHRIKAEREKFRVYLADFCNVPEHWEPESAGDGYRAPWIFHFLHVLTGQYNMTIDQAWNTPVALSRCLYDTWAEKEGEKTLVSEEERKKIEAVNTL